MKPTSFKRNKSFAFSENAKGREKREKAKNSDPWSETVRRRIKPPKLAIPVPVLVYLFSVFSSQGLS
jgi:hypothetical protein